MNKFKTFFVNNHNTLSISKWQHYFEIYERHFNKFQNTYPTILEIGTNDGGGVEMFNYYFDGKCDIITFDINNRGKTLEEKYKNIKFLQGSQTDIDFLNIIKQQVLKYDIIIDDGGHSMEQQITAFKELYYHLSDNGVYLIEDVHTSYWPDYLGGVGKNNTFIEFTKKLIDKLNVWHWQEEFTSNDLLFCKNTDSIHYYDSIIVFERRKETNKPQCEIKSPIKEDNRIWDDNKNWKNRMSLSTEKKT